MPCPIRANSRAGHYDDSLYHRYALRSAHARRARRVRRTTRRHPRATGSAAYARPDAEDCARTGVPGTASDRAYTRLPGGAGLDANAERFDAWAGYVCAAAVVRNR